LSQISGTQQAFNVRAIALRGDPRDEILYKVEELKADVLVVGSRGLGSFKRALLGSVSDYLVHHLKIPVIVARPPWDSEGAVGETREK
jgi:nucleotide-binding universal stress UspA family protein